MKRQAFVHRTIVCYMYYYGYKKKLKGLFGPNLYIHFFGGGDGDGEEGGGDMIV